MGGVPRFDELKVRQGTTIDRDGDRWAYESAVGQDQGGVGLVEGEPTLEEGLRISGTRNFGCCA